MNFASWVDATGVTGFYFEAFDKLWKGNYAEGSRGACCGVLYENGTPKPGMQAVFDGERIADNRSVAGGIPGGPGSLLIELAHVPARGSLDNAVGRALHVNPQEFAVLLYIVIANLLRLNGG